MAEQLTAPTLVGVVPAAGHARRLGPRNRSKELEPVYGSADGRGLRPVACCLLEAMGVAGIPKAFVVTSSAKADVRETLGAGGDGIPRLEHLVVDASPASTYTISIGTAAAGEDRVALGFPDVLWSGDDAFRRLARRLDEADAQVALGLFPPALDYETDGVRLVADARVRAFEPAGRAAGLRTWTLAVWTPPFSRFLEARVARRYGRDPADPGSGELTMTNVFSDALEAGFSIAAETISNRPFLDIGDPDRLEAARAACRVFGDDGGSRAS